MKKDINPQASVKKVFLLIFFCIPVFATITSCTGCTGESECDLLGLEHCCQREENKNIPGCEQYINDNTPTATVIEAETIDVQVSNLSNLFIATVKAESKTLDALSHYVNIDAAIQQDDSLTRSAQNNIEVINYQQLITQLPDDISQLFHDEVVANFDGSTETQQVFLQEKLQRIGQEIMHIGLDNAPSFTHALTLDFVEEAEESYKLVVDGRLINTATLDGAIEVKFLNAYAQSKSLTIVEQEVEQSIKAIYPDATIIDVIESNSDDLTRGFHTECDNAALLNAFDHSYLKCSKYWINGTINYYWGTSLPPGSPIRHALENAMREWTEKTTRNSQKAIKFQRINAFERLRTPYVIFRSIERDNYATIGHPIVASNNTVNSLLSLVSNILSLNILPPIGVALRLFDANQLRNLSDFFSVRYLNIDSRLTGDNLKRIARHELGHVIGLRHEHQRPDRSRFVTPRSGAENSYSNNRRIDNYDGVPIATLVKKRKRACVWGRCITYTVWVVRREHIAYIRTRTSNFYDCKSVMHYPDYVIKTNIEYTDGSSAICRALKHERGIAMTAEYIIRLADVLEITNQDVYDVCHIRTLQTKLGACC